MAAKTRRLSAKQAAASKVWSPTVDGLRRVRGDEAEDAPGFADVLLVLKLAPEFERLVRGFERGFGLPLPEQRLGEEAVVLGEAEVAGGARQLDGLAQVAFSRGVVAEAGARGAEVAEVEDFAVAVADLARDGERFLVAAEGGLVVAAQARRLAEAVEQVADAAAVAPLAVGVERLLLVVLGALEVAEDVVGHAERLQAVGGDAAARLAELGRVGERLRRPSRIAARASPRRVLA